jgi:molybdopterin-guanine dinucleotide biosynthesis protein
MVNQQMISRRPVIIGVGGLTSEVGKTTLLCELLRAFPGWEAIKTTRGHYRSCGKDPQACCVSHLLAAEPVIRSGRELTYSPGKDSGRYWDAGAVNVHWLIATDSQVSAGIKQTLERVEAPGVFVEGNSFTEYVEPDFFVMVTRTDQRKLKPTARRALPHVSALYISDEADLVGPVDRERVGKFFSRIRTGDGASAWPMFSRSELPQLVRLLQDLDPPGKTNPE